MKDFISALIHRHVQIADHVKPRTRGWFDNTTVFEDNMEEVVDENNTTDTPDLPLNRAAEIEDVTMLQHNDRVPKTADEKITVPSIAKMQIEPKLEDIQRSSLTKQQPKPVSDFTPLANEKKNREHLEEAQVLKLASTPQKATSPVENIVESNSIFRKKNVPLPSLQDVTEPSDTTMHGESILPAIRSSKRNALAEPQQKTTPHQPIDVTIGRVEIQAIFPAEEKVLHTKKELKGGLSLEDYLDQKRAKQ